MKTFTTKMLVLVTSALLLGACSQMATYENEDLNNGLEKADELGFILNPYGTTNGFENGSVLFGNEIDCESSYCVPAERVDEIRFSRSLTPQKRTSGENVKEVYSNVYLTLLPNNMAYYEVDVISVLISGDPQSLVSFDGSIGGYSFATYPGQSYQDVSNNIRTNYFRSEMFDFTAIHCGNSFDYIINETSFAVDEPVVFTGTLYLIPICRSSCDEETFDYSSSVEEGMVDVTFEYSYSEEAKVSIDFTFPQIIIDIPNNGTYTGADGKNYRVTGNGTVFHWTGEVSCSSESPTTFSFKGLVPDCGAGNSNDGKANIWTGAKVVAVDGVSLVNNPETLDINEGFYSLKRELSNIVFEGCPTTKKSKKKKTSENNDGPPKS
ncbi:hypothetical protein LV84_02742 [Algoriphagus ratkowskyi]|uniref:Lipoprotein n=1 Tax=Algoriphagus ratkowskyi TaxID=57028 RepID=A0A2W7RJC4_9BACT|nr:hypothetical protein [Algoriphagus ratkowskyi]PZX54589.1 hypothetical protein LV84_02742 [Algoriphagus ratkowskyi]TXD76904.1 hypothetical protein ESW18_13930 [Algoriphagus ratkowskyi]